MVASSINVRTNQGGADPEQVVSGQLTITGQVITEGGDVRLAGGVQLASAEAFFTGNVDIDGNINSGGGQVTIFANHIDPTIDTSPVAVTFIRDPLGMGGVVEGGFIDIDANITTAGGTLTIGSERTRSIQMDGVFNTTQLLDSTENGLVQLIAKDLAGVDTGANPALLGQGEIIVGGTTDTSILTSNLLVESRVVTFSEGAGANTVRLVASGSSTRILPNLSTDAVDDTEPVVLAARGAITITGDRALTFNQNTSLSAQTIEINAAAQPTDLNAAGAAGDERPNSETRLVFGGSGGASAASGVRLSADSIMITVGDGTTTSSDGFSQDLGTSATPTDFGLSRLTRASYDGLQLRDTADVDRPAELQIAQDADLTLMSMAPTAPGELDLVGAFSGASIGVDGMRSTFESSDGRLTVADASGLNNDPGVMPGSDAGKSFVVLNGGLFLPDPATVPTFVDDTVRFGDGVTALTGPAAFNVESLTVSSAGQFTVRQQVVDSIDPLNPPNELVFETGRMTGISDPSGRGSLTINPGITIQAGDRLALLAGASGLGDLIFVDPGVGPETILAANGIELRAGAAADSQNTVTANRARISGLQSSNVMIRDARFAGDLNAAAFGDDANSTATGFSYRQDAVIDGQTDLPDLPQFGLTAAGFRPAGDIAYRVRSDQANINLDDGVDGTNEADRFRNSSLSLIGVDSNANPAMDVSSEFVFVGNRVELGGIGDFTFTQALATSFNRSGLVAEEEITLLAGVGGLGDLDFNRGGLSSVLVKAPRINLRAGNGVPLDDGVFLGVSAIDTRNAVFDLAGPVGSTPTFTFQTASDLVVADLPDNDQFMTEISPGVFQELLPDILALRTDLGLLDFRGFDVTALPLDLVDVGRLILEAEDIRLSQTDGDNLDLTTGNPNLRLRLRTNNLTLIAANLAIELATNASVLINPQAGDNLQPNTPLANSAFDNESLLIEAFDRDVTSVTADNLSSQSEDSPGSDLFTLADGRGPNTISILQDGEVMPENLFVRDAVAGQLTRSFEDDLDGNRIATTYTLSSVVNAVEFNPENVNGSNLIVSGIKSVSSTSTDPLVYADSAIRFGEAGMPGAFFFESVLATTESFIIIQDGTQILATNSLALAAGRQIFEATDPNARLGQLVFDPGSGALTTSLTGNQITLSAGPVFKLEGPDDANGDPTDILDEDLPTIDLTGLDRVTLLGDPSDSALSISQSAKFEFMRGGASDFLTPVENGIGANRWETFTLSVIQGDLILSELDAIALVADSLVAETLDLETQLTMIVPDGVNAAIPVSPFDAFAGTVELRANDMLFQSTDANTSIDLATDKLTLLSVSTITRDQTDDELSKLRDENDPDAINRPIVRIHQAVDFISSELPRPDQYVVIEEFGIRSVRSDLSGLDIELVTGADTPGSSVDLTLDNGIRARVTNANLILKSTGNINIMLSGPTPGFDGLDYTDLQLTSLDFTAVNDGGTPGNIIIRPFTSGGNPATLTISTTGDQRFTGDVVLENTLSTRGRNIRFAGNVDQGASSPAPAGLIVAAKNKIVFEKDIGATNALDRLFVANDSDADSGPPNVEFGTRTDPNDDGNFVPDPLDQTVAVDGDILFLSFDFDDGDRTAEIEAALGMATTLTELDTALDNLGLGRTRTSTIATIGKADGNLTFTSQTGNFVMGSGEKLSVGGVLDINVMGGLVALGDVAALDLIVAGSEIGLVRRDSGVAFDRAGDTQPDGGASILANTINFNVTPVHIGSGRSFRFGLPNPFDSTGIPTELDGFPLFELKPNGSMLTLEDFRFISTAAPLGLEVPTLKPLGSSRSDLSDAFGPVVEPTPFAQLPPFVEPQDLDRLMALAVDAQETPTEVLLSRLHQAAIIDDLGRSWDDEIAAVTAARIDAEDAEVAIALYEELFGEEGKNAGQIRSVLQEALDRYLENSRARRVVGFELRRFVKNRPSTLLEAYTTLDSLDTLFRYHRRLGLSPGEYRGIQRSWLRQIQPDGITLDELSEAIHPSRYVRGSDILDIFGR